MSKPSLHELISKAIYEYHDGWIPKDPCDELAEQIIKIVRDYHLVEDRDQYRGKSKVDFGKHHKEFYGKGE